MNRLRVTKFYDPPFNLPKELLFLICTYLPVRNLVQSVLPANRSMFQLVSKSAYLWDTKTTKRDFKKFEKEIVMLEHYKVHAHYLAEKKKQEDRELRELIYHPLF